MKDSAKIGAAVVGGYLLGRTKKGKTAIGLALWLSGNRVGNPREALARLTTSPEVAKLAAQVRGPLLAAAQRAVTATIESRTTALADSLRQRTSQLVEVSESRGDEDEHEDEHEDEPEAAHARRGKADEADDADERASQHKAKRPAKAARRTPAGRAAEETREPARSRETGRGREPGRRRSAPRGGEAA